MLEAEITGTGAVLVEGQHVGELHGFRFVPDQSTSADTPDGKAIRAAAAKALAGEFDKRAERVSKAGNEEIVLSSDFAIRWLGQPVARIVAGDDTLSPRVALLADEQLTGPSRDKVQARLDLWLFAHLTTLLKPLFDLRNATDLDGIARGVAFRLVEALGTVERQEIGEEVKALDQGARAVLRKHGVRFGAYHIYLPALLKPAPATLVAQLWALKQGAVDMPGLTELPQLSASGRTSIKVDPAFDRTLYRLVGFRVAGERAVRLDILERLADIIRPLIAWKPVGDAPPPDGAVAQGGGFTVTVSMTSLLGCSGEDFSSILKALGYRMEKRTIRVPAAVAAAPQPAGETAVESAAGPEHDADMTADGTSADDTPETPSVPDAVDAVVPVEAVRPADAETLSDPAQDASAEAVAGDEQTAAAVPPVAEAGEDGSADGTEAVAATTSGAAAEPIASEEREIEVWRPGRFDRGRRPDHRGPANRGDQRPRHGGAGQDRGERRPAPQGEGQRRPDRAGQDAVRGKDRPSGDRPRHEGRDDRRPQQGQPADRAPRRDKPVDPNSPFAALLALKADLEQKQKKK